MDKNVFLMILAWVAQMVVNLEAVYPKEIYVLYQHCISRRSHIPLAIGRETRTRRESYARGGYIVLHSC
jgi:hypothetical protein